VSLYVTPTVPTRTISWTNRAANNHSILVDTTSFHLITTTTTAATAATTATAATATTAFNSAVLS
jgi:hypothetical protein